MRRLGVALTCLMLAPCLGGLAACSVSDPSETDRKSAASATAPVAKQAGAAGSVFAPGTIATHLFEGVLQGAGAEGFTFLSDLLFGDDDVQAAATTAQLDQIQTQLDQINTRLDTIDDDLLSIKGQLANDTLGTKLDTMNGWNNKMTSLYREYFLPIASAAKDVSVAKKNVADARAAGTPVPAALTDALAAATKSLLDKRTHFDTAFMSDDPYTVFANQHDEMYPRDPNVSSVFKLAGRAMDDAKGYATWMDSQRLSSLYLTLSDQEALSALLIIEHDKMFGADAATQQRHRDQYVNNVKVEKANLAPEIPWGQVKVGQQMFTVPSDGSITYQGSAQPWLPISPEGVQLGTPLKTFTSENPGWVMPDDTQVGALYDATKSVPALSGSTHLGSIWQGSGRASTEEESARAGWSAPMFWTTKTGLTNALYCIVNRQPDHYRAELHRQYTAHHAAVMNEAAFRSMGLPGTVPDGPMTAFDVAGCDGFVVRSDDPSSIAAKVMLTRTVDASTQDYLAQRSTALAPSTSTPTS